MTEDRSLNRYIIALGIALCATSFSSIFIRLTPASAIIIAFWRQFLASILTLLIIIFSKKFINLKKISKEQIGYFILGGFFLALHFASWILSLFYTTIAQSLVIVNASPAMVVIIGFVFLNEKINRYQIGGILISIIGGLIIVFGSIQPSSQAPDPFYGNILAFIGAVTFSGYIIIGRFIRSSHEIDLFTYTFYIYFISSIFLAIIALLTSSNEFFYSLTGNLPIYAYLGFFLLAIIPTIFGHTLYNYSLKEIKAAVVSVVTLGEPIISSILAMIILFEYPSVISIIGGFIIIFGVSITILRENKLEIIDINLNLENRETI